MSDSQWMSIVEYARTFNVSDMTVRRRIKTGRLQAVLRDGKYYIPSDEGRNSQRASFEEAPRPQPKQAQREFRPQPRYQEPTAPAPERRTQARSAQPRVEYQTPAPRAEFQPQHDFVEPRQPQFEQYQLHRMIDVCESAVKSLSHFETKLEENYRSKVQILEAKVSTKEREIEQLNQKIEDLQLLVSILEKRRS